MSWIVFRSALSLILALLLPAQLLAGDVVSGMLHTNGATWVNGASVPKSVAVFAGDLVQTRTDSSANISADGSSVMVLADSLVKFEGPAVSLEHGMVRVTTSKGLAARAGEVTVKPAGNTWTEFQIRDVDGTVQIAANKGTLVIQDPQGSTTIREGQQTTRDDISNPEERKKRKKRAAGAATAAGGGILSSNAAIYTGLAVVGGITTWVLLQGDEPLSPECPSPACL